MVDYPGEQRLSDVSDPPISGSFTWGQQWNAFRPNNPGDWARFIIEDHWNNPGIDIKRRIVGYNVSVSVTSPLDRVSLQIDAGDET